MANGSIIEVDPATLTIALNVRRDVKLDKEFVASIKQHGVLQPPMVVRSEGIEGYDVVIGQRRTLAAVQAGLKSIPVHLVDKTEGEAARIVDQLTENEQRQQLSDVERVGGYKELALIGISPADIAKRTNTPKVRVESALAVADSPAAKKALESFQITLDQAAEIVEFQDDAAAVEKLRDTAEKEPARFAHVVADLRSKAELAAARAAIEAEITAEKVELLEFVTYSGQGVPGFESLTRLGDPKDPTQPLTRELVKDKKQLGARAVQDWSEGKYVVVKQYLIRSGHEFPARDYLSSSSPVKLTKEQKAAQDAREAEQRAQQEAKARRDAATDVRHAWLRTDLMQRKQIPDPVPILARAIATDWVGIHDGGPLVWDLLGLNPEVATDGEEGGEVGDGYEGEFLLSKLASTPSLAPKVLLVAWITTYEREFEGWRLPSGEDVGTYLEQLVEWGYGLSEFEADLLKEPAAA